MYSRETATSLSHATAVIGANQSQQEKFINQLAISPHDTVILDASNENGIKDVREFSSHLLLSPQFGPVRFGIIYAAEMLTLQAQNALLKMLEEPPERAKLVLFIAREGEMLPTLLSRCRRYYMNREMSLSTGTRFSTNPLPDFLAAESIAKQDNFLTLAEEWLQTVYLEWVKAGRPSDRVETVIQFWDSYQKSKTQINKRLILEHLVVSSL